MHLSSSAFGDGAVIPRQFTCDGEDVSPPLAWSEAPAQTRSFVLLCDDPDAPGGTWHHWAAYDIPAERRSPPHAGAAVERKRHPHSDREAAPCAQR
ncbi:MAG TPA: YbhB/YbcL family Raf kinase inhibitor-like protein, partial [Xanthobacteraceae bacterium]